MSRLVLRGPGTFFYFVCLPHSHVSVFELCPAPTPPRDVPLGLEGTEKKRSCQWTETGIGEPRYLWTHALLFLRTPKYTVHNLYYLSPSLFGVRSRAKRGLRSLSAICLSMSVSVCPSVRLSAIWREKGNRACLQQQVAEILFQAGCRLRETLS